MIGKILFMTEMTITSALTEELDAGVREAIVEVCVAAHGEEDFRNLFTYVVAGGLHFMAYRGEEVVSHAGVTTRWLQAELQGVGGAGMNSRAKGRKHVKTSLETSRRALPGDFVKVGKQGLLRTAYVDAVATLPAYQGQGYGSALLRRLAREAAGEWEIACLETERASFYERLGWEVWRGPLAGRSDGGLVPTPEQTGIMILRLPRTPALDLDGILTIECQPARIW